MYEEENIHSNHDISSKNKNGEEEMNPLEEEIVEPPTAGLKRWIRIGIPIFVVVAIVGIITGVMAGEKCSV